MNRRHFTKASAGALLGSLIHAPNLSPDLEEKPLSIHVFSKHLQFLNYQDMAEAAAELGFDGVDLTVRPGGHVLPEEVEENLPLAIEKIRAAGLLGDMMATAVTDSNNPTDKKVLEIASSLNIKWYRLGYVDFDENKTIIESLETLNTQMKDLATLNKSLNISGSYQNHAGLRVGGEIWEIWHLLKNVYVNEIGCQYDIRHAMVEGGTSWKNSLRLIAPQINTLVLKDFIWEKINGKWKIKNVPLGEGMVDFKNYFSLLKKYKINVPTTIHYEYDLGGVEHGARKLEGTSAKEIFSKMKKDLQFARTLWSEA